jgi:hypothetical protein
MVLAELNVRHTRRHMPTRRVALGDSYLPTSGPAYGAVLLGAVVAEHVADLDEEARDLLPLLVADARDGLAVPRIAMRHRLQTDTHGLDGSRHRLVDDRGRRILELDRHGRAEPQVIGAVMAAAALPPSARAIALAALVAALRRPGVLPVGFRVERAVTGFARPVPFAPTDPAFGPGRPDLDGESDWTGVATETRWAMEVLGMRAGTAPGRADVQARFRRLVRLAHPDHGGSTGTAAARLAELAEARDLLLDLLVGGAGPAGSSRARANG